MLLGNGFFMGIFMATYLSVSDTLFVNELGEYIQEGIFVSGFLGVFTTAIFVYLQNKIPYSKLAALNLIAISLITLGLYLSLRLAPGEYYRQLIFILYVMKGPMIAVVLLGFWGIFGRMFNLRQSKRIIGGIDTGQLSAQILTFFSISLLVALVPRPEDLLIGSAASAVLSLIFLLVIESKYDLDSIKITEASKTRQTRIRDLFKNKYVVQLALFLSFSIAAFLLVENSFLEVLNKQYPKEEEEKLLSFIGWFYGSILILSFIFQTFFNDRIIANYGLKVSLLILPIVLAFFTVVSILAGELFGYVNTGDNTASFFWFFLFIALSKLFTTFLRDALENPTFKLYFMPLDNTVRFDIQAKVEGVVNEFAKFVAGGAILILGSLAFWEDIHYSYFLILILGGWVFVTGKLYNEYRNRIKEKLESQDISSDKFQRPHAILVDDLQGELQHNAPEKAIFSFKLLEKINPNTVSQSINALMKHGTNEVRDYAQSRMNAIRGLSVSEKYIISFSPERSSGNGKQVVSGMDLESLFRTGDISKKRIVKLGRSDDIQDRLYAAELIGNSSEVDTYYLLVDLLHDIDPNVRIAAINAAEKSYNHEILDALIDNLESPKYSNLAMNALEVIGENAFEVMDSAFFRVGQNVQVMFKILQIYGRVGGARAQELLWNKIDYPDKIIVSQVLDSLGDCGFRANIRQVTRIKFAIESDVADIAWNLAALGEIPDTAEAEQLRQAVAEENYHDIDHLYVLLSMLYDARSIQLVKENIESGTSEGLTYAIELLDVFLSEDLKQKIIPVLDDIPEEDKARKLENFYPREGLGSKQVLKYLINRDFNQTNRWSKSCAIYLIGKMQVEEFAYDLIANLFNPDQMVQEVAAWALYQIDPDNYHFHTGRLDSELKRSLDEVVIGKVGTAYEKPLLYDKVLYLKRLSIFSEVPGRILAGLVDIMDEVFIKEGDTFSMSQQATNEFLIIFQGEANLFRKGSLERTITDSEFLGELLEDGMQINTNLLVAVTDTVLFKIEKDKFYELLSDDFMFASNVVEYLYAS